MPSRCQDSTKKKVSAAVHNVVPKLITDLTFVRYLPLCVLLLALSGCGTVVAVADAIGTATVYAVKTVVNTVDAVTPDIVNGDDD
jgi:hypothetical protein